MRVPGSSWRRVMPITLCVAGVLVAGCAIAPHGRSAAAAPSPDDSVSVGYGRQKKSDVTSAISSLSGKELSDQRVARVEQLLEGRVPGVEVVRTPDGDFSIRIRNATSFMGNAEPLYVIDGMPLPPSRTLGSVLAGIAPQDIARIDILKDAGSTAVYGSQGANGVVLIQTKNH